MIPTDTPSIARPCHVLVALDESHCLSRGVLAGINDYVRTRDDLLLHVVDDVPCVLDALSAGRGDAAIVSTVSEAQVTSLARTARPCINVASYICGHDRVPVIASDEHAIGAAVADYYLERGFANLAVFADETSEAMTARREGFADAIRRAGRRCTAGPPPAAVACEDRIGELSACPDRLVWDAACRKWLADLPRPVGIFATSDPLASACVIACRMAGLSVPGDVSVIGVGDDDRFCLTSHPRLSSVRQATGDIGREAVRVLLSMLKGASAPASPLLLPPAGVVARESCGESAAQHPDVAAAMGFIARNLKRRLTVSDIVNHLSVSRRALERQFMDALGRTPLDEIRRMRIQRAKQLLMETDLPLPEVARECGFIRHQRLANAFKSATGMTPSAFRTRTLKAIGRHV